MLKMQSLTQYIKESKTNITPEMESKLVDTIIKKFDLINMFAKEYEEDGWCSAEGLGCIDDMGDANEELYDDLELPFRKLSDEGIETYQFVVKAWTKAMNLAKKKAGK